MLPIILSTFFFFTAVWGGTLCPPRENIYPCSCANINLSKRTMLTIVNCHHLSDSNTLAAIMPSLKLMQIDQFHLYNSFWEAHKLTNSENRRVLPTDWLTLLKIKEIEIYDTALSPCFACQSKMSCKNSITSRFVAMNSSTSEKICTLCETSKGNSYPWTNCMSRLKYFQYSHGQLTNIGVDFFPVDMRELTGLNLSHNLINVITRGAFQKLKRLAELDLSNNRIEFFDFFSTEMNLEFLDLSWNRIKDIDATQFRHLTRMKTLMLQSNDIVELKENSWKNIPETIKNIDLFDNPIHCDCNVRWINSTLHVNTLILGTCATPEDYEDSAIRKASRMLNERCDENGNIVSRKKSSTPKFF